MGMVQLVVDWVMEMALVLLGQVACLVRYSSSSLAGWLGRLSTCLVELCIGLSPSGWFHLGMMTSMGLMVYNNSSLVDLIGKPRIGRSTRRDTRCR